MMSEAVKTTPSVSDEGFVELDWDRPRRIPKHGPLYGLPKRGPKALGDQFVLSLDPATLRATPHGGTSSAVQGIFLFASLTMIGVAIFFIALLNRELPKSTTDTTFVLIMSAGIMLFSAAGFAVLIKSIVAPYTLPILFNRRARQVVQMRGKKRVAGNWEELTPMVEVAQTANPGGVIQLYHLHLVKPSSKGDGIESDFVVHTGSNGQSDCLQYYEFIRRYMEGEWSALPETVQLDGIRQPLLKEFRNNLWTQITSQKPWAERSSQGKAFSAIALLLITVLWYPIILLTLIGSRLGQIPLFPPEDEARAAYDSARDGPMPPEIAARVHPAPKLELTEKIIYAGILALATAVWCWPGIGIFSLIFKAFQGLF